MKLHLPKQLFTALLAVLTLAAPATLTIGSTAWGVLEVEGADYGETSTAISSDTTIAPTADTAYNFTAVGKKLTGTASDAVYNIKLDGPASGDETKLDTIYAKTLHLNTGRYYVDNLSDISNAGTIYVNAQLQFQAAGETENDFVLGGSTFDSGVTNGLGNVGLRIGWYSRSSGINELSGTVTVAEDTRITFQSSGNGTTGLNLSGTLKGSGNIQLDRYQTTNGTLIISGNTSAFSGVLDMDGNVTSQGSATLALGTDSVHLGGLTSSAAASVQLYDGTTSSTLTLEVAEGKDLTYAGTIGSAESAGISMVKSGAGIQTLSGAVYLDSLTVSAGTLNLTGRSNFADATVGADSTLLISNTIDGTIDASATGAKVCLQNVANFDITDYADAEGTVGTSGFVNSIRVANDDSSFYDNKVYVGDTGYTVDAGLISNAKDILNDSTFYVNEDLNYNATTMAGATVFAVAVNKTLTLQGGETATTHTFNRITGDGSLHLGQKVMLKLGEGIVSSFGALEMDMGSELQGNFNSSYHTITVNKLVLAEGATATISTLDGDHNGTYDIKALTGTNANLLFKNASSESNNTRFNIGSGEGSDFSGNIYLLANQNNTSTVRSAVLNILDNSATSNAVIHLLAINSEQTKGRLALGIAANTTVGGINSAESMTFDNVLYGTPDRVVIAAGAIPQSNAQNHDSTASSPVTLTIDVAQGAEYVTGATVKNNLNLIKTGTGGQAFTGDMSAFNGLIEVQEGTLTIGDTSTTTALGLGGTIVNNGILNLNTDIKSTDASKFDVLSIAGITDGFATGNEDVTRTLTIGAGTVKLKDGAKIYLGDSDSTGTSLNLSGNHVTFVTSGGADANTYYVFSTTANTSSVVAEEGQTLSNIHIADGGKLTYDSGSFANVTLTGSGEYVLNIDNINQANTDKHGLNFSDADWTGTVVLTGGGDKPSLDAYADNFTTSKSKLKLHGVGLYLHTSTITQDLILENNGDKTALELNNGTSTANQTGTFSGSISGDGDMAYIWNSGNASLTSTHIFTGDTSQWKGWFISGKSAKKITEVTFKRSGNVFSTSGTGGVKDLHTDASLLKVVVGDSESAVDTNITFNGSILNAKQLDVYDTVTFKKQVQAATANFNDAANVTLGGGTEQSPVTHSIGTLSAANASVTLGDYATLTLGGGTAETPVTHSIGTLTGGTGSMLNLAQHSVLNTITSASGVTLTGSGTYKLADNATTLTTGVALDETWKGTVELKHTSNSTIEKMDEKLEDLGNTSSTVKLSGLSGWFNNGTLDINVDTGEENNTAFTIVNGSCANSGTPLKFNQAISGSGDIVLKGWSGMNSRETFIEISGDISEWDGNIYNSTAASNAGIFNINFADQSQVDVSVSNKDKSYGSTTLVFSGSKITEMNGAVDVERVEVKTDTQFNADVTASNTLTVDVGKTATMNATLSAGTVNLGSTATITGKDSGTVSMTKVKMNDTCISSADTTGATKGSISNANVALAQLAEDASFTIEDMTLTNTTVTAATAETRVNLQNVEATSLALAKGKFTMNAAPTVGMDGTTANFGTNTDSSFMISKLTAGSASLTLNLDVMGAYESTGAVDNVTLTITLAGITGDVSSYGVGDWKALVGFEEQSWLGQALSGAEYTVPETASAAEGGVPSVNYGYASTGSNVGTLTITISGLNVPEPTTSTLSLLALAALAARRRRK